MNEPVLVQIVGAPVACTDGVVEPWRKLTIYIADKLNDRFGAAIRVEYFDLFDPLGPSLPPDAQLPLVMVNGEVLSSGSKISMPDIRRRLESLGLAPDE
jgi:hypothetical protein